MQTHCIFSFFHQISDPSTNRYEVPWPPRSIVSNASNTLYKVTTGSETFNLRDCAYSFVPYCAQEQGYVIHKSEQCLCAIIDNRIKGLETVYKFT